MRRPVAVLLLALCATPAFAAIKSRPVEWKIGEEVFSGVLVYDDVNAIKRPGLVLVPNWMGVTDNAIERAGEIAGDDYVVLVADMYGKGVRPKNKDEAKAAVGKVYADGGVTLRKRATAALAALKAQDKTAPLDAARIGALGFCFGGSSVLELARTGVNLAGVASFHGGLKAHLPGNGVKINTPVLVLNGAADKSVPNEDIVAFEREMDEGGADWQLVNYSGARHCFAESENAGNPPEDNCRYDARAAKRSFAAMRAFFVERFGVRE
ncbi:MULTISPECIES: dienelactone hydrolase family protein [Lysobacter]|uniref:Dienelactone hydrolase family protein n=1 Tax=Lysobacter yananisis TaxID=1003114 RepID=A0ABY9P2H2_9GAMM|nr:MULTISPECIES: dienelactone hydrolase family protein [Lysobacter]QQQ02749.1 dienelactone hydrolase family protein [Lysobacter enzymogenes]WMT01163.1 dienelactone hydrolase family protein [Lysobacter yananisis]